MSVGSSLNTNIGDGVRLSILVLRPDIGLLDRPRMIRVMTYEYGTLVEWKTELHGGKPALVPLCPRGLLWD
jgi:hypothetical protein